MAKIIYEVYQNKNEHNAAYGKWYGRVKYLESMNTRKLSNHIAEHGSIYTPDVVYGVMEKFRSCLLEMLLQSKRVKIEGLGTFYATIECAKGGAVSKDKFNVQKHINGLHIRFLPEQEQETNISSRQFLKQAEFVNVDTLLKEEAQTSLTPDPSPTGEGSIYSQGQEQAEELTTPLAIRRGGGGEAAVGESPVSIDLDQIEQLLKKHCADAQLYLQPDLTLPQLAKAVGTNRYYLSQYFSRQSITYNTYINNLRINYFVSRCQAAAKAGQPIVARQLASESGFGSYSTFARAFVQRTGQSVTAWMRETGG